MKFLAKYWRQFGLLSLVLWGMNLGEDVVRQPTHWGSIAIDLAMIVLFGGIMWIEVQAES